VLFPGRTARAELVASRRLTGRRPAVATRARGFRRSVARSAVKPCAISAASGSSPTGENGRITIIGRDPTRSGSIAASGGAPSSRSRWTNQTAKLATAATRATAAALRHRILALGCTAGRFVASTAGDLPPGCTAAINR
jgi:hypothetical protein